MENRKNKGRNTLKDLKKDVAISYTELMNELDRYRADNKFTKEMFDLVHKARNNKNPITWRVIEGLFAKMNWNFKRSSIQENYNRMLKDETR